jgi:two-component system sensor histidine kinase PilS (NtrC family)
MATAQPTLATDIKVSTEELRRPRGSDTSQRVQQLVAVFRLLVALSLLLAGMIYQDPRIVGGRFPELFTGTAIIYALVAAIILAAQRRTPGTASDLVPVQLIADVVGVTFMMYASGGISSGIGGLLVVFVGAASLTLRDRLAFLGASIATLAILAEQFLSYTSGISPANDFIPAGFLGAIIFIIALAAHPLARRLQESEALAHQRGIDLANLAQLNDYIIQNLRESIVVVDEAENIRLINQSAAEHVGAPTREPGRSLRDLSPDLYNVLRSWRQSDSGFGTMSSFLSANGTTQINTHIAPLEGRSDGPVLIFLEDVSLLAEKVQQSKLAALGRLSASIAHEIRNPVGALSHAGQLLVESSQVSGDERRLLEIIKKNSSRVSEIVENVLQLSRREQTRPEMISLSSWIIEFVNEFNSTLELEKGQLEVLSTEPLEVRMDPSHLRQVCWNLCENAVQYAVRTALNDSASNLAMPDKSIQISYGRLAGNRRPFLDVTDHGPGIPPQMHDQLFEPFATGRAGGTGLGLFISRELCECNRATLVYDRPDSGGSTFRIVFADPQRWGTMK